MNTQTPETLTFVAAQNELRALGLKLCIARGEYCVNYEDGTETTAYYTSDLKDAVNMGRIMAAARVSRPAPLGPTGRRNSRKAIMYRHNRKIAAKRKREGEKTMILVELYNPGELPSIRRVAQAHLLRLAVVEAYRDGLPIPSTFDEATAFMRDHSPRFWTFYSPDEADTWAESYQGEQSEAVRHAVRYFVADSYAPHDPQPESLEPELTEAG